MNFRLAAGPTMAAMAVFLLCGQNVWAKTPEEVRAWIAELDAIEKRIAPTAKAKAEAAKTRKEEARAKTRAEARSGRGSEKAEAPRRAKDGRFRDASDRTGVPVHEARDLSDRPTQRKRERR